MRQLDAPIGLLNVGGYFDPFLGLLEHTVANGFLRDEEIAHLVVEARPAALIERIDAALAA